MDTVDRIFSMLDESGMEQKDFAGKIGQTPQVVSTWRTRRAKSYSKCISQIADVLNTTTEYLLTGEGPKEKVPTTEPTKKELTPAKEGESRDPLDARIMDLVSSLSPAQKKALIEKMEFLISMQ